MNTDSVDAVFIHGLRSSPQAWAPFRRLIEQDPELTGVRVHAFGYASRLFSPHPLRQLPTFDVVADSLRTFLEYDLPRQSPVVLVTHSQGGLIAQRYLARMLADGKGRELARIRRLVLLACPNAGAQLALLARRTIFGNRHAQERELRPLQEAVADTLRIVLSRIVHATTVAPDQCPIPIAAYAGETDGVVTPASARSVFPEAGVLPGDHFSIIRPDAPTHRSYTVVKRHLLAAGSPTPPSPPAPAPRPPLGPPPVSPPPLDLTAKAQLVERLVAIPGITDPSYRQQLLGLLPAPIVGSLRRHNDARLELVSLVDSFDHYPQLCPWQALATALATVAPHQRAVLDLVALLTELGLITPEEGSEVPTSG